MSTEEREQINPHHPSTVLSEVLKGTDATVGWTVLMEGHLKEVKEVQRMGGILTTKRKLPYLYHVLKQSPRGKQAVIEQYDGREYVGTIKLTSKTSVIPCKARTEFSISTQPEEEPFFFMAPRNKPSAIRDRWVLNLQQVVDGLASGYSIRKSEKEVDPLSIDPRELLAQSTHQHQHQHQQPLVNETDSNQPDNGLEHEQSQSQHRQQGHEPDAAIIHDNPPPSKQIGISVRQSSADDAPQQQQQQQQLEQQQQQQQLEHPLNTKEGQESSSSSAPIVTDVGSTAESLLSPSSPTALVSTTAVPLSHTSSSHHLSLSTSSSSSSLHTSGHQAGLHSMHTHYAGNGKETMKDPSRITKQRKALFKTAFMSDLATKVAFMNDGERT